MSIDTIRGRICAFFGLAFYCGMLRSPFFGSLATENAPNSSEMRLAYDLTLIALGVITAFAALKNPNQFRILNGTILLAPTGIALICSGYALNIESALFFNCSAAVLAIGFAALSAGWFEMLSGIERAKVAPFVLGAFVASHLLGLLDLLPRNAAAAASITYPLFSLALLHTSRTLAASTQLAKDANHAIEFIPSAPYKKRYFKRLRLLALLLIFAEILCGAFLRSSYSLGGINYEPHPHTMYTYLVSASVGLALVLITKQSKTATESALIVGGVGLVGFAAILACLFAFPITTLIPFITSLYSALIAYMMALISLWGSDGDKNENTRTGTFLILYALASTTTASTIPALLSYQGRMPQEYLMPIASGAGLIVSLSLAIALLALVGIQREAFLEIRQTVPAKTPDKTSPSASKESSSFRDQAMRVLASRYNLTERERETAELLANGYTTKHVAKTLTVAPSTVQGYTKSIYRKLGIHRKDDLIEMVNLFEQKLDEKDSL